MVKLVVTHIFHFYRGLRLCQYGFSVSPIAAFSYGHRHSNRLRFHLALSRLPLEMKPVGNAQPHEIAFYNGLSLNASLNLGYLK